MCLAFQVAHLGHCAQFGAAAARTLAARSARFVRRELNRSQDRRKVILVRVLILVIDKCGVVDGLVFKVLIFIVRYFHLLENLEL
jgi:hypothetical protein